jgi:serine/threonine protein phosphatase PrpC
MIHADQPHLTVAALSHPGETGKNNEDAFSVTAYQIESDRTPSLLAVIADGIGGHQAGEVAARLAVDTLVHSLAASSGRQPVKQLRAAVVDAGRVIARTSSESQDLAGMGSTIAVAWVVGPRLFTANVGDSRIYLFRGGILQQISTDHTWVQEALEHGVITPEEVRDHPHAHVLRRHLGGVQEPLPDLRLRLSAEESDARSAANQGLRLRSGDQILLCSDGLSDMVTDIELAAILPHQAPTPAVQALVDLARAHGGFDNITVILATVPPGLRRPRAFPLTAAVVGVFLLLVLILAGLAILWRFGLWPR